MTDFSFEQMQIEKWDRRFLGIAETVATWSKDPSTKVGAVIVSPDRRRFSLGYNGFPQGMDDHPTYLNNRDKKLERTVHAEVNAIINRPHEIVGHTIYSTQFPCPICALAIIQSKVSRVVAWVPKDDTLRRWGEGIAKSCRFFKEAGVDFRMYPKVAA